ncbi:MAG: NAD(P)/FAD-dependent oxidoreductase [Dysgonamonadaceae bacterium]|jgi:phytoene dehydrogenase-like protein|nr:NAD(P)/FAD-dependent oxidoreductase [Dysgonamonadaceae bacterium]
MDRYEVIIIGSGLGGLVCANTLAKEGCKVCVLEKNETFGGCLRSYKRRGGIMDTGIHYVGSLDKGQILNQYFRYMGILDKLKLKRLDEDGYDIINLMGKEYKHAMEHENFIETLSHSFPGESRNIRNIVYKFKEIGDLISLDTLRNHSKFSTSVLPYFSISAADFLKKNTSNANLRNVIAGTTVLCGGEEENTALYTFSTIVNSNIESSYRFVDGSQQIADLLIASIQAHGGVVRNNAKVSRLIMNGEKITAAEINHEEQIEGDYFISDIHPSTVFEMLDKTKIIKKAYISRINSLKNSMGFFTLSLILKDNSFPYLNKNFYYYEENNPWVKSDYAARGLRKILFSTSPSSDSGLYAKVAQVLEPMYWHEVEKWEATSVGKRGESYKEFKQERAEKLIQYLEQFHPGIKESIVDYSCSTPLTYRDYTGTKQGSAYGIIKDYNNALICLLPCRTRVPNLFITGQNNNVHGMLGVFLTAMYTCAEFTGTEYLTKKIANA